MTAFWHSALLPFIRIHRYIVPARAPSALACVHVNPLETRVIGSLVGRYAVTFLWPHQPSSGLHWRCAPESSESPICHGWSREAARGASPWLSRTASASGRWKATAAPSVRLRSQSTRGDFRKAQFRQVGGSVQYRPPAAGIAVPSSTLTPSGPCRSARRGLLLVRGPNVMQGYLGAREDGRGPADGWYNTGDNRHASDRGPGFPPHHGSPEPFQQDRRGDGPARQGGGERSMSWRERGPVFAVTRSPTRRRVNASRCSTRCRMRRWSVASPASPPRTCRRCGGPRPDQFVRVEALPYLGTESSTCAA